MAVQKRVPLLKRVQNKLKNTAKKIIKFVGYKWVLPLVYKRYSRKPVDEKLVVFADRLDRPFQDNFKDIYNLCVKENFNCVILTGQAFGDKVPPWKRRKEKLKFNFSFIKSFAQCRCLFLVDFFPLAYICKPRKETQIVQLWHACGVMKKIGYSALDKPWGMTPKEAKTYPTHNTYTLVCASSNRPKETFIDAFRCNPNIVLPIGCPRTDVYFNKEFVQSAKKRVLKMFPEIGSRKIILYAPTYRGNSVKKSHMEINLNFQNLAQEIGEDYVLLVKFHPITAKRGLTETVRIKARGFMYDVSNILKPEEALCAADILISDYSTIYFEYLLLERPIISYIYDIDTYIKDRGLYFPYDQLAPGPYVFTEDELIDTIQHIDEKFDPDRTRWFKQEFMSGCDGHSTQRIFDYVFHPDKYKSMYEEEKK